MERLGELIENLAREEYALPSGVVPCVLPPGVLPPAGPSSASSSSPSAISDNQVSVSPSDSTPSAVIHSLELNSENPVSGIPVSVVRASEESQIHSAEDLKELWAEVISGLSTGIEEQVLTAWIKPLKIAGLKLPESYDGELVVTLSAPNRFSSDHVQRNHSEAIRAALAKLLFAQVRIIFQVDEALAKLVLEGRSTALAGASPAASPALKSRSAGGALGADSSTGSSLAASSVTARDSLSLAQTISKIGNGKQIAAVKVSAARPASPARSTASEQESSCLNPKYNFSNFVVGSCNQLAHAVGLKVAEQLGSNYNPLFLYGGVGLGKTHLANAIGNSSRRRNKKVLLVSSETFVSELISSLRTNRMDQFKSKFRSLDLLIVDDIQFIIGKERTQEEFFHTFNELYNRHKQIIITCDKVPQELVGLEERLRTRFASGISVDLQTPDFETRVAILTKKAEAENLALPDDVARLLAERISTNVRELEGALNRLKALSSLHDSGITLPLAQDVLRSLSVQRTAEVSSESIQKAVAERFNVSLNDLLGKRRTQNIALARQVAMFLCRRLTAYSFPEIGALFGGRDHSTVIHANRIIAERMKTEAVLAGDVQILERRLQSS